METPYPSLYFLSSLFHFSQPLRMIPRVTTPRDRRAAPLRVSACRVSLPEMPLLRSQAPIKRKTAPKMMPMMSRMVSLSSSGRAIGSISTGHEEPDKFIIRGKQSKNGRVIRFLHFRAATTSGVCAGFERCFGYEDFRITITILALVDLAFGHGDITSWVGEAECSSSAS